MKHARKPRLWNPRPIYLIVAPCGCTVGYLILEHAVLPHHLIAAERARGNTVIESDLMFPPRLKACPHRGVGVQEALPGLAPLVNRKAKR